MKSVDTNPVFKIVIAYEHFDAGIRARELSEWLAATLRSEVHVVSDAWKFDLIGYSRLGEQAARAACEANMIIIAASGSEGLPHHMSKWINDWVCQKRDQRDHPAMLVALLLPGTAPSKLPTPVDTFLRRVTTEAGVEFFSYTEDRLPADGHYTTYTPLDHAYDRLSLLNSIVQKCFGVQELASDSGPALHGDYPIPLRASESELPRDGVGESKQQFHVRHAGLSGSAISK